MSHLRPSSEIAKEIRRLREDLGLSQAAFAKSMGTSQSRLGAWERADDSYKFDLKSLEKLAKAGGVPLEVFLTEQQGRALATSEVARLRDRMRALRETANEVLSTLEAALVSSGGKAAEGDLIQSRRADSLGSAQGKRRTQPKTQGRPQRGGSTKADGGHGKS